MYTNAIIINMIVFITALGVLLLTLKLGVMLMQWGIINKHKKTTRCSGESIQITDAYWEDGYGIISPDIICYSCGRKIG